MENFPEKLGAFRKNTLVKTLVGLAVICIGLVATWSLLRPRHLLPYATRACLNAEYTDADSLLAIGLNHTLYEFKGPTYSAAKTLYTAKTQLISVGALLDSPVKVVVGDRDGWLYFPGSGIDPVQAIGDVVFACGITAPKDSSDCTIVAVGHDGINDMGYGGEVRILSCHDQVIKPRKKIEFESTAMCMCIAHKSEAIIVGFSNGELVYLDLINYQQRTFLHKNDSHCFIVGCVLSHDETLLATLTSESVSVRRVSHLNEEIARFKVRNPANHYVRLCWHPTQPDVLVIAEPEAGINLLNVFSNELKFVENKDFVRPVISWIPKGSKSINILDSDWSLITVDLE